MYTSATFPLSIKICWHHLAKGQAEGQGPWASCYTIANGTGHLPVAMCRDRTLPMTDLVPRNFTSKHDSTFQGCKL